MSDQTPAKVLLYSDDRTTREQVRLTLGRRLAADLPAMEVIEVATAPVVVQQLDAGGIDLVILDGEATPFGGMGLAHQLKDEIADCPPVLLLVARVADAWLATWSKADGVSSYPVDPVRLPAVAADLLRARLATIEAAAAEMTQAGLEPSPVEQVDVAEAEAS